MQMNHINRLKEHYIIILMDAKKALKNAASFHNKNFQYPNIQQKLPQHDKGHP